ncbi:unnamed protein product [Amoebophrya sp. A25]|nr:unnamed protein product [Amoebophrya sp. A25]|eukprot:GSA25T00019079001.1
MANVALILARGGSVGIPHKNVKPLCGSALIGYVITAAQESGVFDRVVVSTDDEEIARIAGSGKSTDGEGDQVLSRKESSSSGTEEQDEIHTSSSSGPSSPGDVLRELPSPKRLKTTSLKMEASTTTCLTKNENIEMNNRNYKKSHFGAEIFRRSAASATATASSESAVLEFLKTSPDCKICCLLQATSPLTTAHDLRNAMHQFTSAKADSLVSVVRWKRFFWEVTTSTSQEIDILEEQLELELESEEAAGQEGKKNSNVVGSHYEDTTSCSKGSTTISASANRNTEETTTTSATTRGLKRRQVVLLGKPKNYNPAKRPRRQDWEGELMENGAFYMFRVPVFLETGHRCGGKKTILYEMPEDTATELDSHTDWRIVEQLCADRIEQGGG